MKAILFDLDDTLIDFKGMKKAAITEAAKAMVKAGLDMTSSEVYESLNSTFWEVGIESNSAIQEFLKRLGRLDDRILAAGINGYLKGKLSHTDPVPGALDVIKKLKKKYKVGVITDAPRLKAWQRLNLMGMDKLFDVVIAYEDTGKRKPDEMPFRVALKKLSVKPEEAVMVGDWYERDVEGAKKVGMKAVLVGKPRCDEDWCVSKFADISKLVFN
jgi:putative hydrolase of the HAD superfamily